MQLSTLTRPAWVVVAVIVGLTGGAALRAWTEAPVGIYAAGLGYRLSDQGRFERAVSDELVGQRLFKDVVVHPRWAVDASGQTVPADVVTGLYCDGRMATVGGRTTAAWRPTFFVAGRPYRPLATLGRRSGRQETVGTFLATVDGARFTTAWWEAYPFATSLAVSLGLVGGVWPTVVNLITFGTPARPPLARGVGLWRMRTPPAIATRLLPSVTGTEPPVAGPVPHPTGSPYDTPPAVTPLTPEPLVEASGAPAGPGIEFGKKRDDFYPTARRDERPG